MESVVVLGANPAWQRNVACAKLRPGEVVRLRRGAEGAAGKGFNCSLALRRLGMPVRLVSGLGTDSDSWAAACEAEGIDGCGFPLEGPVRWATTLRDLSSGEVTELVEEGPPAAEGSDERIAELLGADLDLALAICGTLAGGIDPQGVLRSLSRRRGIVLIDSVPVSRCLWSSPDAAPPNLCLKLNESEWRSLADADLETAWSRAQERFPRARLVCTLGPRGSRGLDPDGIGFDLPVLPLPKGVEVHPIGAGDAYTAGLMRAMVLGLPFSTACSHGAAAARASCLDPLPSRLTPETFQESLDLWSSRG